MTHVVFALRLRMGSGSRPGCLNAWADAMKSPLKMRALLNRSTSFGVSMFSGPGRLSRVLRVGCVALLVLGSGAASAWQASPPTYSPGVLPAYPYRGMYYEPGHGGTGLTVDIDNKGYLFAVFYAYTPAGQPYFYLMEGQYLAKSDRSRLETGVLGSFEATPYISEGGQCVGDGCEYKSPTRTATKLHAEIVWTTPRVATLTIGSQTWHLRAGQYTVSDADALEGQWFMTSVVYVPIPGLPLFGAFGSFTLAKTTRNVSAADFAAFKFLSPNSVVYDLTWKRLPHDTMAEGGDYFALYNPETGRVDILQAAYVSGKINQSSIFPEFVAFPDGPQSMRGRHEYARGGANSHVESSYSVESDFTLSRSYPVSAFMGQNGILEKN